MNTPTQQGIYGWFEIDAVDRDNIRWHLANTAAQEAWLAEALADAEYHLSLLTQEADELEAIIWKETRSQPIERITSKGGVTYVDATEDQCRFMGKADIRVRTLRKKAIEWKRHRDILRGYVRAFDTKKTFLSTLGGLTRQEMQMMQNEGDY